MDTNVNIQRNLVPDKGVVIQNITVRPVVRNSVDIEKWRNALKEAEMINPSRVSLFDLYEEIKLDPVLSSLMEKRILGVTKNTLLCIGKDGQENEVVNKLCNSRAFREMRKEILLYKFYGISVIEAMVQNKLFGFYSVPRKNIKPKEGRIVFEQYGQSGIDYRLPPYNKYVFEVGRWDDLGLLLKAAPYVIYKRGGFGDWAHFAEIFGMPFREARYDGYNPTVRAQLETALEQAGSAGYAILPKEAELTFHEAKSTQGSSDLYNMLRQACNEELAILILGQTETTTKTSGKLGGNDQTHENTEDAINMADREDEIAIMNELVMPVLKNLGFPVDGCMFIHKVEDEKLTTAQKVEMYIKLKKEYGLPMDDEYVYEETGIPKPKDYEAQKQQQTAAVQAAKKPAGKKPVGNEDDVEDDPEELGKMSFMDRFKMAMADFFGQAHES